MFGTFAPIPKLSTSTSISVRKEAHEYVLPEYQNMFKSIKELNSATFTLFCPALITEQPDEKYNNLTILLPKDTFLDVMLSVGINAVALTGTTPLGFKHPLSPLGDGTFLKLRTKISQLAEREFIAKSGDNFNWSDQNEVILEFLLNTYAPFGEIKEAGISFKIVHLHIKQ